MSITKDNRESNTREQMKKKRQEEVDEKPTKRKVRIRLIPIWFRILLIVVLLGISLAAGTVIGYSVMGNGKLSDTFKSSTWNHIDDLINKPG